MHTFLIILLAVFTVVIRSLALNMVPLTFRVGIPTLTQLRICSLTRILIAKHNLDNQTLGLSFLR